MKERITRRSAIKRLLGISGTVAFSILTGWPLSDLSDLRAESTGRRFMVEGRGRMKGYSVKELVSKVFDEAGGMARFISRGDVVAIKPNISWARSPDLAAGTNPEVLVPIFVPAGRTVGDFLPVHDAQARKRSGAIAEFSVKDKIECPIKIGSAYIDRGRCLPWSGNGPCIVCEEHCPTSPKAIYFKKDVVAGSGGTEIRVQLPYVDLRRCVGCGICEFKCPVKGRPAIRVISAGESRSLENQILL